MLCQWVLLNMADGFFQIFDPNNKRYEVPLQTPPTRHKVSSTDYDIKIQKSPFGLTIFRKSTGAIMYVCSFILPISYFLLRISRLPFHLGSSFLSDLIL